MVYLRGQNLITLDIVYGTMKVPEETAKEICERANRETPDWNYYYEREKG